MNSMKGRNRYAKNCCICSKRVEAWKGFLKKNKVTNTYDVFHEGCKPGEKKKETKKVEASSKMDGILPLLEAKLLERKAKGEKIDILPQIIDELKSLYEKVGFHNSITGDSTCKNCGHVTGPFE